MCIDPDQPKLAEIFAENGYSTYAIGKLHYLPYSPPDQPRLLHGFQYAEMNEEGRILNHYDPDGETEGLEDYHDYLKSVGWGGYQRAHGIGNNEVRATVSAVPAEHHEESWVATRSIAALERHKTANPDKPFLLLASFVKPHTPYDPPSPYDRMYDPREVPEPAGGWDNESLLKDQKRDPELIRRRSKFGWDVLNAQAVQLSRARYAGLVSFQDEMIGRILNWLDENGLADNTIIVYTADHGDLIGDYGRFFKCSMLDGSVRIPMIWRVPGVVEKNDPYEREQLVGSQDILPTLCSLTGIDLGAEVDGMDLTSAIESNKAPGRDFYVSYNNDGGGWRTMVRTPEWKYIYTDLDGTEELYNAREKDGELTNLITNPDLETIKNELREQLIRWCKENNFNPLLDNGKLKVTPVESLKSPEFNVIRMGWRRL